MHPAGKYAKPGAIGGTLIRRMIAFLRKSGVDLPLKPIDSHILIAVSGGSDSMALAHLLVHYGRRVVARDRIRLAHVNHGWRGAESDADAEFVQERANAWGVPLTMLQADEHPNEGAGGSWEDHARRLRKRLLARAAGPGTLILTAHQADDLAETLLWRLFTGAAATHGGGISLRHGNELRPLLTTRKLELLKYLDEVGESWREDHTNHEGRFLRSRMRRELMPSVERLFPRAIDHLVRLALHAQEHGHDIKEGRGIFGALQEARDHLGATGRTLRAHAEGVKRLKPGGEIHLPGGWRLTRVPGGQPKERWMLEKYKLLKGLGKAD